METKKKNIQIRDSRRRQMFRIDDEYIERYARFCGVNATAVYSSLCRHADKSQESWPSIERIMEQHGIKSKHTVLKAIKVLESYNIVSVHREKDPETKRQMVNVYTLVDRSEWVNPGASNALGAGCKKNTDPGAKNAQKPGAPNAPEGSTEEKDTQRRNVANATDSTETKQKCGYDGCSREAIRKVSGEYLENCKDHQPMTCAEFVEWYRKDSRRYINLVAELADEVKPMWKTVIQWEVWASQHYRAAIKLQAFDDSQIAKAFRELKGAAYINTFNLYTVLKFLTNGKK